MRASSRVALLLASLLAASCAKGNKASTWDTAKVTRAPIVAKVTASGTLSALVTVQVGAQVSGRISKINVDFNDTVKKGQVVAQIDPQLFEASVQQAKANLTAAEGNLEKAKAQAMDLHRIAERDKPLVKQNLIAQAQADTDEANALAGDAGIKAAEGTVEQARANLNQADVNLGYTTIISPIDGTVISRNVDVGQTVASALQAPTLFTIAQDLAKMQVDTNVAEADVGKLTAGMEAGFTVDAWPGVRFVGKVRQVRDNPITVQNVVTYDAVIDVSNPDAKLKPGMTANVTFVYAKKDDALAVPNAALRFRPPQDLTGGGGRPRGAGGGGPIPAVSTSGGTMAPVAGHERPADQRTVWVLKADNPSPVMIQTGVSDGTVTEVVQGDLAEGDLVITGGGPPAGSNSGRPPMRIF